MNTAVIGLGSNINSEYNIEQAKNILSQKVEILALSRFVKTKPIGFEDQDDFLNGTILIRTQKNYEDLKFHLKEIEQSLGRNHGESTHGPRTIDLDIIVWNKKITDQDFFNRDFLRNSVLELIPDLKY